MSIDVELEADDLRAMDAFERKRQAHQLRHWHPQDPDYWDDEDTPEQEIDISGVVLLAEEGAKQ